MLFTSLPFLYFFLPAVLLCSVLMPRRFQNAVLLAFSLLFYFCGEPRYTLLILFSALSGYVHGLLLDHANSAHAKKAILVSACVFSLGALGVFKYADLAVGTVNALFGAQLKLLRLALPIGISFYTFQILSYVIDVYRGEARAEKNPVTFFTYVTLFPQLIAGPIVRYTDVSAELKNRTLSLSGCQSGLRRFLMGLAKKVLLANVLGELVAAANGVAVGSVLSHWLSAAGFMLQIYFDFSAYSDMAIGLGRMLGFPFPENFDYPYLSKSVTEFWRRWHMTLSRFFRDYVYIPLGGNRVPKWRWALNLLIVWTLTGLWHGASWTFALWGIYYFILLLIEKSLPERLRPRGVIGLGYTLLVTLIGFVLFESSSLSAAVSAVGALFGAGGILRFDMESLYLLRSYALVLLFSAIGATKLPKYLWNRMPEKLGRVLEPLGLLLLLAVSTAYLVDGSFNPFLYFRF